MEEALFWIYMANAVVLLNHEIDSAYWEEWKLMNLNMGIKGFLLIHFPLIFIVLYGLVEVRAASMGGFIISLILGITGVVAFSIHMRYLKKGRQEFNTPLSKFILWATLALSLVQLSLTIYIMI